MSAAGPGAPRVVALYGPTAIGKTAVAIELAELLRARGEDPIAISADSIQVYAGLELLSGAASPMERGRLEHRLVGFIDPAEEFSAGRFAELAHREIDSALDSGRTPIVVGGTGLYMRAALGTLDLRPPVPAEIRATVERDLAERGAAALHSELGELAAGVHPNDRKRVARLTELSRAGIEPHRGAEGLWAEEPRHPTLSVGLVCEREELDARIERRAHAIAAAGAADEVRAALRSGASRTARSAIGFGELEAGDVEALVRAQRRFARRQLTWIRRTPGIELVDRTAIGDADVAGRVRELLALAGRG
ncbi:tRNA (adenosine(37)-N6)-dimethylallyltransferase MiaA [Thermoleophilia bacterium SCSIO 60948]|nr:tRNA (adenosine(37)-N6)-dimethylallyltransferase MiaA [Thermoleophilia bacterium SCSIO 60948]